MKQITSTLEKLRQATAEGARVPLELADLMELLVAHLAHLLSENRALRQQVCEDRTQLTEQAGVLANLSAQLAKNASLILGHERVIRNYEALAANQQSWNREVDVVLERQAARLNHLEQRSVETAAELTSLAPSIADFRNRMKRHAELLEHSEASAADHDAHLRRHETDLRDLSAARGICAESLERLSSDSALQASRLQALQGALDQYMARLYSIERALSDRPLTDHKDLAKELQAHSAGLESIKSILADFSASSKSAPYQPIYLGKGLLLTKSARDLELICNSDDIQLTPFLIRNRIWEPNLTRLFNELLQPGMTYLEVGANIGYFTTLAASLVGNGGRVHAFEPNPTVFRLLGLNVAINHQGYLCTLEPLAVADSVGEREFYSFHYNISSSTLSALPAKLLDEFQERPARSSTRCTSLDAYYGVSETVFDFVKIDAEGAECLIFEGGREFFRRHIHASTVICLECNPPALSGLGTTPGGLLGLVRSYGFMVWKLEGDGDLIPVHDVEDLDPWCLSALVASRSPIRGRQAR